MDAYLLAWVLMDVGQFRGAKSPEQEPVILAWSVAQIIAFAEQLEWYRPVRMQRCG